MTKYKDPKLARRESLTGLFKPLAALQSMTDVSSTKDRLLSALGGDPNNTTCDGEVTFYSGVLLHNTQPISTSGSRANNGRSTVAAKSQFEFDADA